MTSQIKSPQKGKESRVHGSRSAPPTRRQAFVSPNFEHDLPKQSIAVWNVNSCQLCVPSEVCLQKVAVEIIYKSLEDIGLHSTPRRYETGVLEAVF